ncbi:hypothetical protein DICPUDRAFT_152492 [Dictyostelium purpureum]|uniref:Uncharacterized protein n=1 Tax=Dictyostelium purpureum TaxID=5786 RepID=F0ZLI1_DICPU|nr:uncharacterized protein DICPUDRAFT_152492 [Dictyostelium purpureum]EGC35193.1 hypothetical protein DICPUDRAFT_152492 [Dictyostelium purpureum]|eukprot:XP_003288281.1 hypothetical protein DICPUDRAFT_152492 [Dictyostelium purpureum]
MGVYFNPLIDLDKNRKITHSEAMSRARFLFESDLFGLNLATEFGRIIIIKIWSGEISSLMRVFPQEHNDKVAQLIWRGNQLVKVGR